ncbi:MAG: TnpV protein [Clostridia bacterium]|nr:TnpV protein [Clostridia bacterium]
MKDNLKDIGILGRRHYDYLKKNKPTVINVMRMNGTLNDYLKGVNEQAEEMLFQLVKQMAKAEGVTEQLKATDQLRWVGLMNNIRNRAMEMVNNEVILV